MQGKSMVMIARGKESMAVSTTSRANMVDANQNPSFRERILRSGMQVGPQRGPLRRTFHRYDEALPARSSLTP